MDTAMEEIRRVGKLVGGTFAARWARELKLIAAKLAEGSRWGPKHTVWSGEARRMKLASDIAEYGFNKRQALVGAKALADALPALEAKARDAVDALEVAAVRLELEAAVADEVEQARMSRGRGGKSFFFPAEQDADAERLLRRIGGRRERGAKGPGGFDEIHLARGLALIAGDVEPDGDAETRALAAWQAKWGRTA